MWYHIVIEKHKFQHSTSTRMITGLVFQLIKLIQFELMYKTVHWLLFLCY